MSARVAGMKTLELDLDLFPPRIPREQRIDCQRILIQALLTLVLANLLRLKWYRNKTPLLYSAGVRYFHDPTREYLPAIRKVMKMGFAECKAFSCWRVAELQWLYGVPAAPHIIWTQLTEEDVQLYAAKGQQYEVGDWMYHAVVRRPRSSLDTSPPPLAIVPGIRPDTGALNIQHVISDCYSLDEYDRQIEDEDSIIEDPSVLLGMNWEPLYAKSNRMPNTPDFAAYVASILSQPQQAQLAG